MFKKILLVFVASLTATLSAGADHWVPIDKPIRVVIPYSPGGGTNAVFKIVNNYAITRKINLVPEFKPGAEGTIGIDTVLQYPADGYTVLLTVSTDVLNNTVPHQFKTSDLYPVSGIASNVLALVTSTSGNVKTFEQFGNIMKTDPTQLAWGIPSTSMKEAADMLVQDTGVANEIYSIPFNGAGPTLTNVIGGHVDVALLPGSVVAPAVKNKMLTVLAEIGDSNYTYFNGVNITHGTSTRNIGYSLFLSANAPESVRRYWTRFLKDFSQDPTAKKQLTEQYLKLMPTGPEAINQLLASVKQ